MYLFGREIDQKLGWPIGRAERLARQRKLPHVVLPDGALRFEWEAVEACITRISASVEGAAE